MSSPADIIAGNEFPYQDYIVLAGQQSPGRATVQGAALERKWDVRDPQGASGANAIYYGEKLIRFQVRIDLWTPEQFADWTKFAKLLQKEPAGRIATAMRISHPLLNVPPLNIQDVVVENCSQMTEDDDGMFSCTIDFLQFRPPKPAEGKPVGSTPGAGPKVVQSAQDAGEEQIAKLVNQITTLANQ